MNFSNRWVVLIILLILILILSSYSYSLNQQDESQQIQHLIFTLTTSLVSGLTFQQPNIKSRGIPTSYAVAAATKPSDGL